MTIVNEIKNEKAIKYDVKSSKAEEFINDAEILASIEIRIILSFRESSWRKLGT